MSHGKFCPPPYYQVAQSAANARDEPATPSRAGGGVGSRRTTGDLLRDVNEGFNEKV